MGGVERNKDILKRFFGSRTEEVLVQHVLHEIGRGRELADIMGDPFVTNRAGELERRALLDHTEIVEAVGAETAARIRSQLGPQ